MFHCRTFTPATRSANDWAESIHSKLNGLTCTPIQPFHQSSTRDWKHRMVLRLASNSSSPPDQQTRPTLMRIAGLPYARTPHRQTSFALRTLFFFVALSCGKFKLLASRAAAPFSLSYTHHIIHLTFIIKRASVISKSL